MGRSSARVADVTEILLSLTTVKNVMVSMDEDSCHWTGEVPVGRVKGRTIKWVSEAEADNAAEEKDVCRLFL
jgi:hypothetical protein